MKIAQQNCNIGQVVLLCWNLLSIIVHSQF